jgi:hypothetical protein
MTEENESPGGPGVAIKSFALVLLYVIPALLSIRAIVDPDMFWHMKAGEWIVQHHAVPADDPFSAFGQGRPWVAYSWLFEVLFYGLYQGLGWTGILLYRFVLWIGISIALHRLVQRLQPSFAGSFLLTAVALVALTRLTEPRPWLFTFLFFIVELDLLLFARETGRRWPLLVLPFIFALWANIHIQFVYGLALIAIHALDAIRERVRRPDHRAPISPERLVAATAACVAATLVNPYHVRLWGVVYEYAHETQIFSVIGELEAIRFRSTPDWFVLGLTLGAALALGWRRERSTSDYLLLALSAFCAFRAQRDTWFVTIVATSILARVPLPGGPSRAAVARLGAALTAALVTLAVFLMVHARDRINAWHEKVIAANFPDAAARFVEDHHLPGPLWNAFGWGGYLIWRLPRLPVSMDGRTNLHGEERIIRASNTLAGRGWKVDPELGAARVVIASVWKYPLTELLSRDERFELVYSDDVAAVFVAREPARGH